MGVDDLVKEVIGIVPELAQISAGAYFLGKRAYREVSLKKEMMRSEREIEAYLLVLMAHLQSGNLVYTEIPSEIKGLRRKLADVSRFVKSGYGWGRYFIAGKPDEIKLSLVRGNDQPKLKMELVYEGKIKHFGMVDLGTETRESISRAAFNLKTHYRYPFHFYG